MRPFSPGFKNRGLIRARDLRNEVNRYTDVGTDLDRFDRAPFVLFDVVYFSSTDQ
ncbi:MAG: hypothetical protein MI923_07580 [Phycisphaerales bacterium]|nr:hypothetical protein [Phycisphaerales bacterium]